MTPKTIDEAEKDVLQHLCNKYELQVSCTGRRQQHSPIKDDLINALLVAIERRNRLTLEPPITTKKSLPNSLKGEHTTCTVAPSAKEPHSGQGISTDENDMQIDEDWIAPVFKVIRIRFYDCPKDWQHAGEIEVHPTPDGGLDTTTLQRRLGVEGKIRVINPHNFRLVHEYIPGYLDVHDLTDLQYNGYLHVTAQH